MISYQDYHMLSFLELRSGLIRTRITTERGGMTEQHESALAAQADGPRRRRTPVPALACMQARAGIRNRRGRYIYVLLLFVCPILN